MPVSDYLQPSLVSCGSLKYGSLAIFVSFLLIGTWGTNHFIGINVRELIMIQQKLQANMVTQPKTPPKPPPKVREAPVIRLSEREDPVPSHSNEDPAPTIDLNCTGPCAKSLAETMETADEEGDHHEAENKINIFLQTVFQNLSNEKQEFPDLPNEQQKFQNLSNEKQETRNLSNRKQEFQNLSSEKPEFQNLSNGKQEFQNLSSEKPEFQNLSNGKQELQNLSSEKPEFQNLSNGKQEFQKWLGEKLEFQNLLNEKLELQNISIEKSELDSEEMGYDTTDNIALNLMVPDGVNGIKTNMNKSVALHQNYEISNDLFIKTRGSFAAGAVFSVMWVASIYGLVSMATEVKELLIAPIVMFVIEAVTCVGLVFIDMGVFETTGILNSLLFLGAVAKILVAVFFLYCFFVVFSYYRELRDSPSAPQTPTRFTPPGPAQTPPRPAPPTPK